MASITQTWSLPEAIGDFFSRETAQQSIATLLKVILRSTFQNYPKDQAMKKINCISLMKIYKEIPEGDIHKYLKYYGITCLKTHEITCINSLLSNLLTIKDEIYIYDGFYVGYKIPQIGKEFDLIKFDNDRILNIEVKTKSTEEKIRNQLIKNKYYLKFTGKSLYLFSYESETNTFYMLSDSDELVVSSPQDFILIISKINSNHNVDIDEIFDPSNYLVSPFNSTNRFLKKEYFLTNHQDKAKKEILNSIISEEGLFVTITGGPGTGKTLFIYDLAREYASSNKKVLIIHCGSLNSGHLLINSHYENGNLKIIPIKNLRHENFSSYNVIIVDETQRIYPRQLEEIISNSRENKIICIFSYDKNQTLSMTEENYTTISDIESIADKKSIEFSNKIRTNEEIGKFISLLMNKKRSDVYNINSKNIEIDFFDNFEITDECFRSYQENNWKILRLTPSQYENDSHKKYYCGSEENSHEIIGQEFDKVAVVIDKNFSYKENGSITYNGKTYYNAVKMLFQNITRTKKKLKIILVGNKIIFDRCLDILG